MERKSALLVVLLLLVILPVRIVSAQDGYSVSLSRLFGTGMGSNIRGLFKISLKGAAEDVASVTFTVDGEPLGTVAAPPFELQFQTDDLASGKRVFGAIVEKTDGSRIEAEGSTYTLLSADEDTAMLKRILIPLFGGVFGVMALVYLIQYLATRKRKRTHTPGEARVYGVLGGAVCPKCQRPTMLHLFGFNLGLSKYDRCENCGKWSVMRRASAEELRAAELRELEGSVAEIKSPQTAGEAEQARVDDSRYYDG